MEWYTVDFMLAIWPLGLVGGFLVGCLVGLMLSKGRKIER